MTSLSYSVMVLTVGQVLAACSDSGPSEPEADSPEGTLTVTGADPTTLPLDSTFTLRVFGSGFATDSKVVLT
jgi:hypothetical protein